ncbi:Uncharacterised protein [uncultured Clostridium sp.]|nr:Uncharacterised protein [uncultured Clostridium sp.]
MIFTWKENYVIFPKNVICGKMKPGKEEYVFKFYEKELKKRGRTVIC